MQSSSSRTAWAAAFSLALLAPASTHPQTPPPASTAATCTYDLRSLGLRLEIPCVDDASLTVDRRYFRVAGSPAGDPRTGFFLEIFRPRHPATQTPEMLRQDCEPGTVEPLGTSGHVCRPRSEIDTTVTDLFAGRAGGNVVLANLAAGDLSPAARGALVAAVRQALENLSSPEDHG